MNYYEEIVGIKTRFENSTEAELKWLITRLRFIVADAEYQDEIKKQDDLDFMNWIYNTK